VVSLGMVQFKNPELACKLFIAKVEAVNKENMRLRIINQELMILLEKNGIDYNQVIKNIDFGEPSEGVIG